MSDSQTHKRGQVEWALWKLFSVDVGGARQTPPRTFHTRINRLLEIDRSGKLEWRTDIDTLPYAFFDGPPEGLGTDVEYTVFNTFCLGVGLDLLDAGYKQGEVVFLIKHIRPTLEDAFERILTQLPSITQDRIDPEMYPHAPTRKVRGFEVADTAAYLLIEKLELSEAFPSTGKAKCTSSFLVPKVHWGIAALVAELQQMTASFRKALIVELSHTALYVHHYLPEAPLTKRGRKG